MSKAHPNTRRSGYSAPPDGSCLFHLPLASAPRLPPSAEGRAPQTPLIDLHKTLIPNQHRRTLPSPLQIFPRTAKNFQRRGGISGKAASPTGRAEGEAAPRSPPASLRSIPPFCKFSPRSLDGLRAEPTPARHGSRAAPARGARGGRAGGCGRGSLPARDAELRPRTHTTHLPRLMTDCLYSKRLLFNK